MIPTQEEIEEQLIDRYADQPFAKKVSPAYHRLILASESVKVKNALIRTQGQPFMAKKVPACLLDLLGAAMALTEYEEKSE